MPAGAPAQRSGAAKSKEEAESQQACAAPRNGTGSPTGKTHTTQHKSNHNASYAEGQLVMDRWLK
jgi:hypothetical protein